MILKTTEPLDPSYIHVLAELWLFTHRQLLLFKLKFKWESENLLLLYLLVLLHFNCHSSLALIEWMVLDWRVNFSPFLLLFNLNIILFIIRLFNFLFLLFFFINFCLIFFLIKFFLMLIFMNFYIKWVFLRLISFFLFDFISNKIHLSRLLRFLLICFFLFHRSNRLLYFRLFSFFHLIINIFFFDW